MKLIIGVVLCTLMVPSIALSQVSWSACTPAQIGPAGDIVRLQVTNCNTDPSNDRNGWVTLSDTGTNQQMAAILTAMALNKPVAVATAGLTDEEGYNIVESVIFNNTAKTVR